MSPMGAENASDASQHYEYVQYVRGVHGKEFENISAIILDNRYTNKAFARGVGNFSLGCHNHRYNPGIKYTLSGYSDLISMVPELMKK